MTAARCATDGGGEGASPDGARRRGGADAAYVLDFNLATNPLCNYSPHYNCPIPLRENMLPVAIRAGEMTYPARHHD
jgi:uncharacterized protein (DUF1684 family)